MSIMLDLTCGVCSWPTLDCLFSSWQQTRRSWSFRPVKELEDTVSWVANSSWRLDVSCFFVRAEYKIRKPSVEVVEWPETWILRLCLEAQRNGKEWKIIIFLFSYLISRLGREKQSKNLFSFSFWNFLFVYLSYFNIFFPLSSKTKQRKIIFFFSFSLHFVQNQTKREN